MLHRPMYRATKRCLLFCSCRNLKACIFEYDGRNFRLRIIPLIIRSTYLGLSFRILMRFNVKMLGDKVD